MDAIEYFEEKKRMLNSLGRTNGRCNLVNCVDCPLSSFNAKHELSCAAFEIEYPKKAVAIVEKWAEEQPQKTILQDFLEKYPNALLDEDDVPVTCCRNLGFTQPKDCYKVYCKKCWNRPLPIAHGDHGALSKEEAEAKLKELKGK